MNCLSGLASNRDSPNLSLPSSKDYNGAQHMKTLDTKLEKINLSWVEKRNLFQVKLFKINKFIVSTHCTIPSPVG
jgi:hypothetical protein